MGANAISTASAGSGEVKPSGVFSITILPAPFRQYRTWVNSLNSSSSSGSPGAMLNTFPRPRVNAQDRANAPFRVHAAVRQHVNDGATVPKVVLYTVHRGHHFGVMQLSAFSESSFTRAHPPDAPPPAPPAPASLQRAAVRVPATPRPWRRPPRQRGRRSPRLRSKAEHFGPRRIGSGKTPRATSQYRAGLLRCRREHTAGMRMYTTGVAAAVAIAS